MFLAPVSRLALPERLWVKLLYTYKVHTESIQNWPWLSQSGLNYTVNNRAAPYQYL